MINRLRDILVIGLLLALGIASAPALALGLGQLQMRSQPGEPLLAEIPIVTSDPSELDNLQARLASPDTFRRIGLQPPQGIVSDLQFQVALDARGNPVIRVTSAAPVQEAQLTFLIEVDWGQGRLVREYSALVDAPRTVSAPAQPPIQAPVAPPSNSIVRPQPPEPIAATEPEPAPDAASAEVEASAPDQTPPAEPQPEPSAIAVAPPPAPPAPAPAAVVDSRPGEYGPVQAGDTLGEIAQRLQPEGRTLDQTMLALLRANPGAFINDNVNLVKQGAILRMPGDDALSQYSASQARAVVREQISQWRQMRQPAPQPEAVAGDAPPPASSPAGSANAPRVAGARLEITPPSQGSGQRAGTRSGIAAGGEGQMLRQEMQQARETLAARNAEVDELKARVAELETLQQQQQQLISLKDSELAAAQQRLATSNQQPAPTLAGTTAPAQPEPAASDTDGGGAWLWPLLGLALIAAGIVGWLLMRRKPAPAPGRSFQTSALAAGMPGSGVAMRDADDDDDDIEEDAETDSSDDSDDDDVDPEVADRGPGSDGQNASDATNWNSPPAGSDQMASPTWHSGSRPVASTDLPPPREPARQAGSPDPAPAGNDQVELARAYIDLGDADTARSLLQEVAEGGDADARDEARRLLREMG